MNKKVKNLIVTTLLIVSFGLFFAPSVKAYTLKDAFGGQLSTVGSRSGFNTSQNNIEPIIGNIISVILSFLGVIFLILMIYGGYMWMTAAGNEEKVKKAIQLIQAAILGLIIVVGAYAITVFLLGRLSKDLLPVTGAPSNGSYDPNNKSGSITGQFCCVLYGTSAPVRTIGGCTAYTEDNAINRNACSGSGDTEFLSSACPSGCPTTQKLGCCVFTNIPLPTACDPSLDSADCTTRHPGGSFNADSCSPSLGCP